jgi:hypothetical protein
VTDLGVTSNLDEANRPDLRHWCYTFINRLVNRTPPITSAVQIRSVALRVTQCFQPSRMIPIRLGVFSRLTTRRRASVAVLFRSAVRPSLGLRRVPEDLSR